MADRYEAAFHTPDRIIKEIKYRIYTPRRKRFLTLTRYPKNIMESITVETLDTYPGYEYVGIVIQGPICKADNYTLQQVVLYRRLYPDIKMVVSTWKGELSEKDKGILKKYHCDIVESDGFPLGDKGEGRGLGSANNQLCSSLAGIKALKEMGCRYALKTRTDIVMHRPDFLVYFMNLLKLMPKGGNAAVEERLINVSFSNTKASVPFHMSDFIWFGSIEDMERLYGIPWVTREQYQYVKKCNETKDFLPKHDGIITHGFSVGYRDKDCYEWWNSQDVDLEYFILNHEEVYIAYHFYEAIYQDSERTDLLSKYHKFLKECIIIVDAAEVRPYHNQEKSWNFDGNALTMDQGRVTHSIWLDMLCSDENFNGREKRILD